MHKAVVGGIAILGVAGVWYIGFRPDQTTTQLPDAGNGTESVAGAALADVIVPETFSLRAQSGKTYFDAVCSTCHGANAAGQDKIAPPLVHKIYEPSHHGDAAFSNAARNGVQSHHWPFGNMPPVERRLTDGEIAAIVEYIRELQRANGIN